ncbi:MAG TPA: PH domain-containing protein [Candidatus Methylomirabilis sp.]|nr:PH domain-containing protein [Candidatus Methylomirabilis sp.]
MIPEVWIWLLTTATALGAIAVYGVATLEFRLGDEALEILALGVPFRTIPYVDIQSVHPGGSLWNEHWVTFRLQNRITLRLQRGRRRAIVISPPEPEAFLRLIQSHLDGSQPPRREECVES